MARARTSAMEVRPVSAERSIAVRPDSPNARCGRTRSVARRVSGGAGGAAGGEGCDDGSARLPTRHRWQDAGALGCGGERTKLANAAALRLLSLLATGHSSPPINHAFALQYHSLPLAITRDYTLPLLTKISLIATHCPTSPLTAAHQRLSSLIKPQATQRGERVGRRCSSRVGAHHHPQALPSISASLHHRSSEAVLDGYHPRHYPYTSLHRHVIVKSAWLSVVVVASPSSLQHYQCIVIGRLFTIASTPLQHLPLTYGSSAWRGAHRQSR